LDVPWVGSLFKGEAQATEKPVGQRSPLLPGFACVTNVMLEDAHTGEILTLRQEVLMLKAISCQKEAELTKLKVLLGALKRDRDDYDHSLQELDAVQQNLCEQAAHTAELAPISDKLRAHIEQVHREAQDKDQHLAEADDELMDLRWQFEARRKELTYLHDRIGALDSSEATLEQRLKAMSEDAEESHRRVY
jgi:chromosome segregation ATPase